MIKYKVEIFNEDGKTIFYEDWYGESKKHVKFWVEEAIRDITKQNIYDQNLFYNIKEELN